MDFPKIPTHEQETTIINATPMSHQPIPCTCAGAGECELDHSGECERVQTFLDELAIMEGYELRRKDGSRVMTTVQWQNQVRKMLQYYNLIF